MYPKWKYEVWEVLSTKYYLQEHLMSNFCVLLRFRHDFYVFGDFEQLPILLLYFKLSGNFGIYLAIHSENFNTQGFQIW